MQKIGRSCGPALLVSLTLAACEGGGTSVPLPAAIEATSPLTQEAAVGATVPEPPAVRVLDGQGRPLAGVGVTFAVTSGGGSLATPLATTDASGVASPGSWTLGTAPGTNAVTATATGLPPVTFVATGRDPCEVAAPYALLTTIQASLATRDCQLSDGAYADFYSVAVAQASGVSITMASGAVDSFLALLDGSGNLAALNDDDEHAASETPNAALRIFLPAGSYLLAATSFDAGETGAYTLASTALAGNVECQNPWIVPGVQLSGQLTTTDCLFDGYYSDDFLIVLQAGQRIRIRMSSSSVDAQLGVWSQSGLVAQDNDGGPGTDALLDFTAPSTAVYLLEVGTALAGQTGAYTVSIEALAAASAEAAPSRASGIERGLGAGAKVRGGVFRFPDRRRP